MTEVVIFGTAQRGEEAYEILTCISGYKVAAFSDNEVSKWNTKKRGLDIIPPEKIREEYPEAVLVIASSFYVPIRRQLDGNGWIPRGGCFDSVTQIVGGLTEGEKDFLSLFVKRKTRFYNLRYTEREVANTEDSCIERYLVICNGGYPKKGNPRCAFVHRRVLEYIKSGLRVEAFGLIPDTSLESYEYQGVRVWEGGVTELQKVLKAGNYKKILIHFVDEYIMDSVWKAGYIDKPMLIWGHGYEMQPWTRTWFNYTEAEIQAQRQNWKQRDNFRKKFLKELFHRENILFIFVSDWLKNRTKKFVGCCPADYTVIPNFIDCGFYQSPERKEEDRLHILSIKNHNARTYANDLTAKAILELSEKEFFNELSFELYGDGVLFEENFGELINRDFSNVHIHRGFVSQEQMRDLYKENGIFLSPTRMDSHQVTAGEAMSAEMAVVTSSIGPMNEFMDEDSASLFESENYRMMAEEIEYLYDHPEEFMEKCKNAKKRVERQCGYNSTVKREIALILKT